MSVLQAVAKINILPSTEKYWSTKVNIRKNKVPTSQWNGHPCVLGIRQTDKSCRKLVPNRMNLRESGFLRVTMADEFLQKALQNARIFGDKMWSRVVSTEQKCTQVDMADAVLATALSGILGISSLSWCPTNWIVSPSKNNFKLSLYWFSLMYCFFAGLWKHSLSCISFQHCTF